MEKAFKQHSINFVNMSFVFAVHWSGRNAGDPHKSFEGAYRAVKKVIKENKDTLFIVAAGNSFSNVSPKVDNGSIGINVDKRTRLYPVAFEFDNILSVGAIDADQITTSELPNYKIANYSNYGLKNVDVLAPGTGVELARPGNHTTITDKGTSFATPYVSNLMTRLSHTARHLHVSQLKELVMKTVYIPDLDLASEVLIHHPLVSHKLRVVRDAFFAKYPKFFPVKSGGIVFPERAIATAKLLAKDKKLSVENAVLQTRKQIIISGESASDSYFKKLKLFWAQRQIGDYGLKAAP